jgi:hypothetical protein
MARSRKHNTRRLRHVERVADGQYGKRCLMVEDDYGPWDD